MKIERYEPTTYSFTQDNVLDHRWVGPTHTFSVTGYRVSAKKFTSEYKRLVDNYGAYEADKIIDILNGTEEL